MKTKSYQAKNAQATTLTQRKKIDLSSISPLKKSKETENKSWLHYV